MFNETSYPGRSRGFGDVSLTPTQQQIAARIVEIGQQRGATDTEIQAALSAGWVESRYRNLPGGDRDSAGVMQQRPSQGWGSYEQVTNIDYSINAFYDAASRIDSSGMTFGQLAQAVQRSGFPLRYGQAGGVVDQILNWLGGLTGAITGGGAGGGGGITTETITAPVDLFSGASPLVIIGVLAAFYFLTR